MNTNIKTIYTWNEGVPTSVTAIVNNKHYTADNTNPNWDAILVALQNGDADAFVKAIDTKTTFLNYTEGKISIVGNEVRYGNERLGGVVVDRIFGFLENSLPVRPILKFLNRLYQNPSSRAINELYRFLEHKNMPLTDAGTFLAYKGLNADLYSVTAGTIKSLVQGTVREDGRIFNGVGETVEIRRNEVDDDKDNTCSYGLHAGSMEYATTFGSKTVIVEIDPADVISIPSDCNGQKLRTCKYKVVAVYERPLDSHYDSSTVDYSDIESDGSSCDNCNGDCTSCDGIDGIDYDPSDAEGGEVIIFDYVKANGDRNSYTIEVESGDKNGYLEGFDMDEDEQFKRFNWDRISNEVWYESVSDYVKGNRYNVPSRSSQVNYHNKRDRFGRFIKK